MTPKLPPNTYRIMAWLMPEPEGGYSVIGINLPGLATQGETVNEAFANLKEAAAGLIEAHMADGTDIHWARSEPAPVRPTKDTRTTS